MALFLTKPILWNTEGYRRPSGVAANSGFPHKHGFGHEEWNNATALSFTEDGVAHRVFHTEGVGHAPVADEAGRTFVFLYASHDRVQELVGVAGNATCLIDDEDQRQRLVAELELEPLGAQAWAVPRVRVLHRNDRAAFDKVWRADLAWIPNWRCPADTFLWLARPALLDPQTLRGTAKLLTMFGRHTEIDRAEALKMLESVPEAERSQRPAVLRASHIIAWSRSTDHQRLDGANGLLLTADLDALFDRGLISFADDGRMLVSAQVPAADRALLGLPRPLRKVLSQEQKRYLAEHRRYWAFA